MFYCELCNYNTDCSSNLTKHKKTAKHKAKEAGEPKKPKIYRCSDCNYETTDASNYNKHRTSGKHKAKKPDDLPPKALKMALDAKIAGTQHHIKLLERDSKVLPAKERKNKSAVIKQDKETLQDLMRKVDAIVTKKQRTKQPAPPVVEQTPVNPQIQYCRNKIDELKENIADEERLHMKDKDETLRELHKELDRYNLMLKRLTK